jgi:hypothetical protein
MAILDASITVPAVPARGKHLLAPGAALLPSSTTGRTVHEMQVLAGDEESAAGLAGLGSACTDARFGSLKSAPSVVIEQRSSEALFRKLCRAGHAIERRIDVGLGEGRESVRGGAEDGAGELTGSGAVGSSSSSSSRSRLISSSFNSQCLRHQFSQSRQLPTSMGRTARGVRSTKPAGHFMADLG